MAGEEHNEPRRRQIERIVRDVLAEMAGGRVRPAAAHAGGELALGGKVISLRDLEDRLDGIGRVVIGRGAVITPAARDVLRQRQIAIASAVASAQPASGRLVIARAETNFETAGLMAALMRDGINVAQTRNMNLVEAVDELCRHVASRSAWGLLATSQTAAALCLANRQRAARAALATSVRAVADAVASVAPNLLVVDPAGKSMFEIGQLVRTWLGGRPQGRTAILERLGSTAAES
jgi:hypothetical protein